MKRSKIVIICIAALISVLLIVFFAARYGWRLFGFDKCSGAWVDSVEVGDGEVKLEGSYPFSITIGHHYVGYVSKVEDGTLYFGVRFNDFFGVLLTDSGRFNITIPVDEKIDRVVLVHGEYEETVWPEEVTE